MSRKWVALMKIAQHKTTAPLLRSKSSQTRLLSFLLQKRYVQILLIFIIYELIGVQGLARKPAIQNILFSDYDPARERG